MYEIMDIKILRSCSFFSPSPYFPTFTIPHRIYSSFLKLKTYSSLSHRELNPALLRQPDYRPNPPEQPETLFVDEFDNNTILDVLRLFDGLKFVVTPDIYASLIADCTRNRSAVQASQFYSHMQANGRMVKHLKGSSGLLLFNRILLMFVSCGCLDFARKLFEEMPHRNSVSLGVLIAALVNNELFDEALGLFVRMYECCMYRESYKALHVVVACVLNACVCRKNLNLGKTVHGWLLKMGYGRALFAGVEFIEFYGKCRCLSEANRMLRQQTQLYGNCEADLWTCAIVNNCRQGNFNEVINVFLEMGHSGITMNKYTLSSVLKACGRVSKESLGHQVHANAIKSALDTHVFVLCGLIDMYGRCGLLTDAKKVFNMIDHDKRSSACWNAMLTGLIEHGMQIEALKMLFQMEAAGIQPNQSIVNELRVACGSEKHEMSPSIEILLRDGTEPG